MTRINLYVPDGDLATLRERAKEADIPLAELIRRYLADCLTRRLALAPRKKERTA